MHAIQENLPSFNVPAPPAAWSSSTIQTSSGASLDTSSAMAPTTSSPTQITGSATPVPTPRALSRIGTPMTQGLYATPDPKVRDCAAM